MLQRLHSFSYVEYFLVGCGPACPAASQVHAPKWLRPCPLAVETAARLVTCEKQRSLEAIKQELEATGNAGLCTVCRDMQSRFVTPMPRRTKHVKRRPQDDFLGGLDEGSAAESGDEATTVSSDAGHEGSEAEAEPVGDHAMAPPSTAARASSQGQVKGVHDGLVLGAR